MNKQNRNGNSSEGIIFGVFAILFMVYWLFLAIKGGASPVTLIFGIYGLFTAVRIAVSQYKARKNNWRGNGGYNTQNSGGDPWEVSYPSATEQYGTDVYGNRINGESIRNYCPYCGIQVKPTHEFCKNCGRNLSD